MAAGHLSPSPSGGPIPTAKATAGPRLAPRHSYRPVAATCVVWPPNCELEHGDDDDGEIEAGNKAIQRGRCACARQPAQSPHGFGCGGQQNRLGQTVPAGRAPLSLLVAMFMCPGSLGPASGLCPARVRVTGRDCETTALSNIEMVLFFNKT